MELFRSAAILVPREMKNGYCRSFSHLEEKEKHLNNEGAYFAKSRRFNLEQDIKPRFVRA